MIDKFVCNMIKSFFKQGHMLKEQNKTNATLIRRLITRNVLVIIGLLSM